MNHLFDDYQPKSAESNDPGCGYAGDLFLKHLATEQELLHKEHQVLVRKLL